MDQDEQKPQQVFCTLAAVAGPAIFVGSVTAWLSYKFAPDWFGDALAEAQRPYDLGTPENRSARRREIIFAVCCAESYLFEWTLHEALKGQLDKLADFIPFDDRRGVFQRWKEVTKKLHNDGHLAGRPDFGGTHADAWRRLIDFRDGLIHANASRPDVAGQPSEKQPEPSFNDLNFLVRGWPTRVVTERIKRLHKAAGTKPPEWLVEP